jgi:hypothetical protein
VDAAAISGSASDVAVLDGDPIVTELRAKGSLAVGLARDLVVNSPESKTEGLELVARARKAVRTAETRRTALVKPHNDHVKAINAVFRTVTQPFSDADSIVSKKVLDFDREERRRAAEAAAAAERQRLESEALLREAEKAEAAGNAPVAEQLLEKAIAEETGAAAAQSEARIMPRSMATADGSVGIRNKPWTYRVVDESQVPREYLAIDSAKVREAIRGGVREISGLEIYQEEGLAVRA